MKGILENKKKLVLASIITTAFILSVLMVPRLPQVLTVMNVSNDTDNPLVKPLEVEKPVLKEVRANSQGLDYIFDVPVHNPNFYPARVESIKGDLYVNERKVSQQSSFEGTRIPSGETKNISFKANAKVGESLKATPQVVFNKLVDRETSLEFDGELQVKLGSKTFSVPFQREWQV